MKNLKLFSLIFILISCEVVEVNPAMEYEQEEQTEQSQVEVSQPIAGNCEVVIYENGIETERHEAESKDEWAWFKRIMPLHLSGRVSQVYWGQCGL